MLWYWANTSDKTNIQKLQLVKNFAARIISGIRKYDHISEGLRQLQWHFIIIIL